MVRAKLAVLVDHYHLSLDQIRDLTDRTIQEVYFHARTKEGAIRVPIAEIEIPDPETEPTEEDVLRDLGYLRQSGLITEENYQQCVADTKRKFSAAP